MPFTVAHAMAVLPAVWWHRRLRLDPTCLVIGSMAPDFEYFVRAELVSRISHTLPGLVTWNLPATLILAVLWHHVVKRPALAVLPQRLAARAEPVFGGPWVHRISVGVVASLVISSLLGAATHYLWDGVTHADGLFPPRIAALRDVYVLPVLGDMPLHRVIQHTSTVIALGVLTIYVGRALRRAQPVAIPDAPRARIRIVFAICIAFALALSAVRLRSMHIADPGSLIAGIIAGLLGGTLVASLLVRRTALSCTSLPRP